MLPRTGSMTHTSGHVMGSSTNARVSKAGTPNVLDASLLHQIPHEDLAVLELNQSNIRPDCVIKLISCAGLFRENVPERGINPAACPKAKNLKILSHDTMCYKDGASTGFTYGK